MSISNIEYEQITKYAQKVLDETGKYPTIHNVREATGYGMSKVNEAITIWKNNIIAWEVLGERVEELEAENETLKKELEKLSRNKK